MSEEQKDMLDDFLDAKRDPNEKANALAKSVLPENIANVVAGLLPSGVEPQGIDRARELVEEIFERVPWDAVTRAMEERSHKIVQIDRLKSLERKSVEFLMNGNRTDGVASHSAGILTTLLHAQRILLNGLCVEEGNLEAVQGIRDELSSQINHMEAELKRLREARDKIRDEGRDDG